MVLLIFFWVFRFFFFCVFCSGGQHFFIALLGGFCMRSFGGECHCPRRWQLVRRKATNASLSPSNPHFAFASVIFLSFRACFFCCLAHFFLWFFVTSSPAAVFVGTPASSHAEYVAFLNMSFGLPNATTPPTSILICRWAASPTSTDRGRLEEHGVFLKENKAAPEMTGHTWAMWWCPRTHHLFLWQRYAGLVDHSRRCLAFILLFGRSFERVYEFFFFVFGCLVLRYVSEKFDSIFK